MTEVEKMMDGKEFIANDEFIKLSQRVKILLKEYNDNYFIDCIAGRELLGRILPNAHASTMTVQPPFYCDLGFNVYGGENAFFNCGCVILDTAKVTLGRNLFVGPNVQFYPPMHHFDHLFRAQGVEWGEPITVGDDCWIGGSAVICPGVTIGDRVIVGAGSVVTRDIPDDSVVVGNPARLIRRNG